MTSEEIVDIISKKYPEVYFYNIPYPDCVKITINNREYLISIVIEHESFSFVYNNDYTLNLKGFKIRIKNFETTEKDILSKFRKLLRYIKRLDSFIYNKNEIANKIKPIIESFIKREYNLDIDLSDIKNSTFNVTFPTNTKYVRRKHKTEYFNFLKNKIENVIYQIYVNFEINHFKCVFTMTYSNQQLLLIGKDEYYTIGIGQDITKIIRAEKLKSLFK